MPTKARTESARTTGVPRRACDYFALTKPQVVVMVLFTALVGFYLGEGAALLTFWLTYD
jgi:heme O synthase-like polyprenyltransferase